MSANLTQIFAARPMLGVNTTKDDVSYMADVSAVGINKDVGLTRHELTRAIAESAKVGASKHLVPFLPLITGLTGAGPTKVDGVVDGLLLADVQIPCCFDVSIGDTSSRWKLRLAGGDVADGLTFITPANGAFAGYLLVRIA